MAHMEILVGYVPSYRLGKNPSKELACSEQGFFGYITVCTGV